MTRRFDLLKSNRRDITERQATLRGAITWSWDLLAPWEQSALAQAAVFDGGFTLEAAEEVIDLDNFSDAPFVMDVIESLVDKSLVRTWQPDVGETLLEEPRFGLLVSIHAFASEQLRTVIDTAIHDRAIEAHGHYFSAFGADDVVEHLDHVHSALPRRVHALELDNMVTATKRALERGAGDVAYRCGRGVLAIVQTVGPWALGIRLVDTWLTHAIFSTHQQCQFLLQQAQMHHGAGHVSIARQTLRRAHTLLEAMPDPAPTLWDLYDHLSATIALGQGQSALAAHHLRSLETRITDSDTPAQHGRLDLLRADVFHARVALDQALTHYDAARSQFRTLGALRPYARALMGCAAVSRRKGRFNAARQHLDQALETYASLGLHREEGQVLCERGRAAAEQGFFFDAELDLANALFKLEPAAARLDIARVHFLQGVLHWLRGAPEPAAQEIERAQQTFRALGMHNGLLETSIALSRVYNDLGEGAQAETELIKAIELADRIDNLSSRGMLHYALGAIARRRKEWDKALRHYTALHESARVTGDPIEAALGITYQGLIYILRADWARARHCLHRAMDHFATTDPNQYMGLTLTLLAQTYAMLGQPTRAVETLDEALNLQTRFEIKQQALTRALEHAATAIQRHDPAAAQRALRAVVAHYETRQQRDNVARITHMLDTLTNPP